MPISKAVNPRWWWAFVASALIVLLDQATKYLAVAQLMDGPFQVLPFLTFRYFCNTGAAFSILQEYTHFLTVVGVVFVGYFSFEIWRLRKMPKQPTFYVCALALILAGAGGNLIDRATLGCVVDFVHVHYGWFNFPIFNIADSAVCIGAASWIVAAFQNRKADSEGGADDLTSSVDTDNSLK